MNCKECNHPIEEHIHKLVGCVHVDFEPDGTGVGCLCMLDQQAAQHSVQADVAYGHASKSGSAQSPTANANR